MARIPYVEPATAPPKVKEVFDRLPVPLNIFKIMAHAETNFRPLIALGTSILTEQQLSARLRELAILRVALLNGADYEYRAHLPFALQEGLSQEQIDALPGWPLSPRFDERERAVLAYTDAMTRGIRVPDAIFEGLRRHFDERETVELTATIGGYNLVSRFLVAMQLD